MSVERGGRAAKLGNTYERLWAVRHALLVIEGRFQSVLWEPIGDDENGVDLWVTDQGGYRAGYQLKRQNENKGYWSVADLREEGVLQAAKVQLDRDSSVEYVFVSSDSARNLRDLAERSRRDSTDPVLFVKEHVNTEKSRKRDFQTLLSTWGLDPARPADVEAAFRLLQRMTFEVSERTPRVRREVEHIAALQIDGDPNEIVATIGDLLDNNLGHEFHADELRQRLMNAGYQFRTLAGHPSLPGAIEHLQDRFVRVIEPRLITHTSIPRPESADIAARLLGNEPPRIVFVHGSAGAGKSVVLYQVFQKLQEQRIPTLPVQLHTAGPQGSPDSFGRDKCCLPGSPALALRALAGERRAVLIFDQLDALRLTSVHSHEAWTAFVDLVEDALADPKTTVVVACRSFDLENDPNISVWSQTQAGAGSVTARVGELPDEVVAGVVNSFGIAFAQLPVRQRRLLKQSNTLALWCALAESGELTPQFENATHLMRQFIRMRREEATRDHNAPSADLDAVLKGLVRFLDENGRLDAPTSICAAYPTAVNALCSVGLLEPDASARISFAHQSYFDHLVAEGILAQALQNGRDPAEWLRENQSLFRRDQLRQLLTLLRESDPGRHEALLRSIVLSADIRFHLKHLVLGLLHDAEPVLEHEARLVIEMSCDSRWRDHLYRSVLLSRQAWFDALDRQGTLVTWLSGDDEQWVRQVLRFLRSVAETRGPRIDDLLAPYWDSRGTWNDWLLEILSFNPCDDSPRMAELRLSKVRSGAIAFGDLFMEELGQRSPERLVELLGAALAVWVERILDYCRSSPAHDPPGWGFHDRRLTEALFVAVKSQGDLGCELFSGPLRTIARLRHALSRGLHRADSTRNTHWRVSHVLDSAHEFIETLLIASIEGMAQSDPVRMAGLLESWSERQQEGLERAIARGIAVGHPSLADSAIGWLYARPSRFRLGDGYKELYWGPARAIIERLGPFCSEGVLKRLAEVILAYHEPWEHKSFEYQAAEVKAGRLVRNDWGRAQNVLLGAIPEERMSPTVRLIAATWRRKFGDPANEKPIGSEHCGGSVTSPIPGDQIGFVSDREWLRIIRSDWASRPDTRWRQLGPNVVVERSLEQFANALGAAARQNPKRFAALALRIPATANPAYFSTLLRGLTPTSTPADAKDWEPASVGELEAVIEHVGACRSNEHVQAVCRVVHEREDGRWSDRTIQRVLSYVDHPHPCPSGKRA